MRPIGDAATVWPMSTASGPSPANIRRLREQARSTVEIAAEIVDELRAQGVSVELLAAGDVEDLSRYDAVVIGSAVYMKRWRREARHLLHDHATELASKPFWIFSSGPFGETPDLAWAEPPKIVKEAERLGVREHVVFGGRLPPHPVGPIEKAMVRSTPDTVADLRDWDEIRTWARSIAAALGQPLAEAQA